MEYDFFDRFFKIYEGLLSKKKRLLSRFKTPKKSIAFFRIESKNLYKK